MGILFELWTSTGAQHCMEGLKDSPLTVVRAFPCPRPRPSTMAVQAGSDSIRIHSFLVSILGEAPGTSGDVLERMNTAFPGHQGTVRQVINDLLVR